MIISEAKEANPCRFFQYVAKVFFCCADARGGGGKNAAISCRFTSLILPRCVRNSAHTGE